MDDEYITRRVKPQAVVSMPLSLKRWIEDQARERRISQSDVVVEVLLEHKARIESGAESDAIEALAS